MGNISSWFLLEQMTLMSYVYLAIELVDDIDIDVSCVIIAVWSWVDWLKQIVVWCLERNLNGLNAYIGTYFLYLMLFEKGFIKNITDTMLKFFQTLIK